MGGKSEREFREKLNRIRDDSGRREKDVKKDFAKIERLRLDSLKKAEEILHNAEKNIDKIEKDIMKSKDLAPESKERLRSEINSLKSEVESKYSYLRTRISETMVPTFAEQVSY